MAGTGSTLWWKCADGGATRRGGGPLARSRVDHLAQGVRQHAEFGIDGTRRTLSWPMPTAMAPWRWRSAPVGGVDHQAAGRALERESGRRLARGGDGVMLLVEAVS